MSSLNDLMTITPYFPNPLIISLEEAKSYLNKLDLDYLIDTMCGEHYPLPRWTLADAKCATHVYKNFLYLQKKHFPFLLVPTREVDECWHNHILYTKNYFHDCYSIFGHYLHHQPASPSDNPNKLIEAFEKTKQLYLEEFRQSLFLVRI